MKLCSVISDNGDGGLVSQWASTIKALWVRTVKSWCTFWYDLRFPLDVKQQQTNNKQTTNTLPITTAMFKSHPNRQLTSTLQCIGWYQPVYHQPDNKSITIHTTTPQNIVIIQQGCLGIKYYLKLNPQYKLLQLYNMLLMKQVVKYSDIYIYITYWIVNELWVQHCMGRLLISECDSQHRSLA